MALAEGRAEIEKHHEVVLAHARWLVSFIEEQVPPETKARLEAMLARTDAVVDWHERQFEVRAPSDPVLLYLDQPEGSGRIDALVVDGEDAWDLTFFDLGDE